LGAVIFLIGVFFNLDLTAAGFLAAGSPAACIFSSGWNLFWSGRLEFGCNWLFSLFSSWFTDCGFFGDWELLLLYGVPAALTF